MGEYDAPNRTAIVRSTLPSTTQRMVLLCLSMHIVRPVRQRGSSLGVGVHVARQPVRELVGGRGPGHGVQPVQGAAVDVAGVRDLALVLEPLHRRRRLRVPAVADVACEPRDLAQPGLEVTDAGAVVARARAGVGPGGGTAPARGARGAVTWRRTGAGRGVALGVGEAEGRVEGVADGSGTTTARVTAAEGVSVVVARETAYPRAQVPTRTPETMARVATLLTPAPMSDIFAPRRRSGRATHRSGRCIGCARDPR